MDIIITSKQLKRLNLAICCLGALLWLSGCAGVGPSAISMGRADYNAAINKTEDEQILLSIVKGRYGETTTLLAVSGVAANVRFRADASIDAGVGPEENYAGNLVPLSGGLAYEENPTITYAPVMGEKYFRQVLSPIPMDTVLLSILSVDLADHLFTLLVSRVNNLRNPDFLYPPAADIDSGFTRFVALLLELNRAGVLDLATDAQNRGAFDLVIQGYRPGYTNKVEELLELINLEMPKDQSEPIVIPVYHALKTDDSWSIGILTRSTFDLIEILRASIEIPETHAQAGLTVTYPPVGLAGQNIRIISSTENPGDRSTSVKYRGYWFYIDETDHHTKQYFQLLRAFWSIIMSGSMDQSAAPILTLPVGR